VSSNLSSRMKKAERLVPPERAGDCRCMPKRQLGALVDPGEDPGPLPPCPRCGGRPVVIEITEEVVEP